MTDAFTPPVQPKDGADRKAGAKFREPRSDALGKITAFIGGGTHAQNSIVVVTIVSAFVCAIALAVVLLLLVPDAKRCDASTMFGAIKDVWGIFVPLITLALGYAFGKGRT